MEYVTQHEQRGTAHAIGQASAVINEPVVALNDDLAVAEVPVALLAAAACDGENATAIIHVEAMHVEDPSQYGVVDVKDGYVRDW